MLVGLLEGCDAKLDSLTSCASAADDDDEEAVAQKLMKKKAGRR